jgi:hypothetical protein
MECNEQKVDALITGARRAVVRETAAQLDNGYNGMHASLWET